MFSRLREMLGGLGSRPPSEGPLLHLAAFGKHPGWEDHMPDMGLETPRLIETKRLLYIQGIGGNVNAGAWDELGSDQSLPGFQHALAWFQDGDWVLGRIWSSADAKGRSRYPMVLCVESRRINFASAVRRIFDRLGELEAACRRTRSGPEVTSITSEARDELRAGNFPLGPPSQVQATASALAVLQRDKGMGGDREGLLRVLYEIQRARSTFSRPIVVQKPKSSSGTTRLGPPRSVHLRVPRCAGDVVESIALWSEFLAERFSAIAPRWVICPLAGSWVDLLVAPTSASDFFCLLASPDKLPLTTEIPYQIDIEFAEAARGLIKQACSESCL